MKFIDPLYLIVNVITKGLFLVKYKTMFFVLFNNTVVKLRITNQYF